MGLLDYVFAAFGYLVMTNEQRRAWANGEFVEWEDAE